MNIKSGSFSWSRIILNQVLKKPTKHPINSISRKLSTFQHFPSSQTHPGFSFPGKHRLFSSAGTVQELLKEVEWEKQKERDQRKRAGQEVDDIDAEDEEDYMGVGPMLEKLEKEKLKDSGDLNMEEEPTDSESDDDDERFTDEAMDKQADQFMKKFKRHEELLKNFTQAGIHTHTHIYTYSYVYYHG